MSSRYIAHRAHVEVLSPEPLPPVLQGGLRIGGVGTGWPIGLFAKGSNSFDRNMPSPNSMMESLPPPPREQAAAEESINPWDAASVR
jgi:hypothetical protein